MNAMCTYYAKLILIHQLLQFFWPPYKVGIFIPISHFPDEELEIHEESDLQPPLLLTIVLWHLEYFIISILFTLHL